MPRTCATMRAQIARHTRKRAGQTLLRRRSARRSPTLTSAAGRESRRGEGPEIQRQVGAEARRQEGSGAQGHRAEGRAEEGGKEEDRQEGEQGSGPQGGGAEGPGPQGCRTQGRVAEVRSKGSAGASGSQEERHTEPEPAGTQDPRVIGRRRGRPEHHGGHRARQRGDGSRDPAARPRDVTRSTVRRPPFTVDRSPSASHVHRPWRDDAGNVSTVNG
jgi:hypothetical protein